MALSSVTTHWTGAAGDGQWDNPDNWDNGVPPPGADYAPDQDVAVIDNSVDTAPFTVTIAGSQGAGDLTLDALDPAGGTAVSLTGELDFIVSQTPSGGNFGNLILSAGTFEIDGGRLDVANVEADGGALTFGAAATYGSSTLAADLINVTLNIGNDSDVVIAATSFDVADGPDSTVVTVSSGSTLDVQGFLYLGGTLDIQAGGTALLDGGGFQPGLSGSAGTILVENGNSLVDTANFVFQGVTLEGGLTVADGDTITTRSGTVVFEADASGDPTTVSLGSGSVLDVQSTLDLYGTVSGSSGTVVLDEGGVVSGGTISAGTVTVSGFGGLSNTTVFANISAGGGTLNVGGTVSVGSDSGPTTVINLGGGALVVSGTLDLFNTVIENGYYAVVGGGSIVLDGQSSETNLTSGLPPTSTSWTGADGNGQWSDPANWTNGVPPLGGPYQNSGDDVATIDTAPQTIDITGTEGAAQVTLDTADPAGGPAILVTGELDLGFDNTSNTFYLGAITLSSGTLELDGGSVVAGNIQQEGGTVTFGTDAPSTLDAAGIDGSFTLSGATLVAAQYSFASVNDADFTGAPSTVTVTDNGELDVKGSLSVAGAIDLQTGELLLDGGQLTGGNGPVTVTAEGGAGVQVSGNTGLANVDFQTGFTISSGQTITVLSNSTVTLEQVVEVNGGGTLAVQSGGVLLGNVVLGGMLALSSGSTLSNAFVQGGGTVVVSGSATLSDSTVDSFLTLSGSTPYAAISGTVTIGDATDQTPVVVNLGGGELDVFGALNLDDAQVSNGVVVVEPGATLSEDADTTLSAITTEQTNSSGTLIEGQNVVLTSGTFTVAPGSALTIETGVNADGTPSGSAGTFTIENGVTISGAGVISVSDANGPSTTFDYDIISGIVANVPGETLQLATDVLGGGGLYTAEDGATLVLGDGSSSSTVGSGGALGAGQFDVLPGSTIEVDSVAPITSIGGTLTLSGTGSEFTSISAGKVVPIEQTLTTIGQEYPYSGRLQILGGRDFTAANALTLDDSLVIGGGTLTAPSIGVSPFSFLPVLSGFGTVDASISGINVEASGGTLTLNGGVGDNTILAANAGATLLVNGSVTSADTLDLYNSATLDVTGALNGADVNFFTSTGIIAAVVSDVTAAPPVSSGGALLIVGQSLGQTINVNGTSVEGDSIDLQGVIPEAGSAGVAFTRPTPYELQIIITTSGGTVTIDATSNAPDTGFSTSTDSAGTGTLVTFGPGPEDAMPVVTPGPNETTVTSFVQNGETTSAFMFTSVGHVSMEEGATLSDTLVIYNTADGNSMQGTLGGSVVSLGGDATATGTFSGIAPGGNTGDLEDSPEGYGGDGTPITVSLPATQAGHVTGTVTLGFDSTSSAGQTTALGDQQIDIEADIYALANAYFPKQVFYIEPNGQDTQTFNLPVEDYDDTGYNLTEGLRASVASQQSDLGDLTGAFGSSGLIASDQTDSTSLSFTVDSNPDDFADGLNAEQTGDIDVAVVSDGTGTSNAGTTPEPDVTVPVYVYFVQQAKPSIPTPQVFYAHASTVPATQTFALSITNAENPDGDPEEALIATLAGSETAAPGTIDFTNPSATTGDVAAGQTNTSSIAFTVDTDLNDTPGGYAGSQTGSATLSLVSDGTAFGGSTTDLGSKTANIVVDFIQLAEPAFPVLDLFTHETLAAQPTTTLELPVSNTDDEGVPQDNLQATVTGVTGDFSSASNANITSPVGTSTTVAADDQGELPFQVVTAANLIGSEGLQTGSFTFGLTSVPTESGFQSTTLPSKTVNVTVTVQDYADPVIEGVADPVTNLDEPDGGTPLATTIDLPSLATYSVGEHEVTYSNVQTSDYEDDLSVNGVGPIAPGGNDTSELVYGGDAAPGLYSETVEYDPVSVNDTSGTDLTPVDVTYEWAVYQPIVPAQAHGDVHLLTYDNTAFDFQAAGEFILTKSTTPGNPFEIDIRLQPLNGSSVTYITEAGIQVGNDTLNFDPTRGTVLLNGAVSTLSASDAILNLAAGQVVQVGNVYHITLNTGEAVTVTDNGSFLDVAVTPGANDPGHVTGLLGPANGGSNDFQLSNGTFLTPNASGGFNTSDILGSFANSWRIAETQSPLLSYGAGQTTSSFDIPGFPNSEASLATLPASVVTAAEQAVAAAGITDPTLAAEATLDYALTNSPDVLASGENAQQQSAAPSQTNVTQDTTPPPGVGLSAAETSETELAAASTAVNFTVYLTGTSTSAVSVGYEVTAPDSTYLGAAAFGGTLPSGTVTFQPGQSSTTVTIQVPAGALGTAPTSTLQLSLDNTGNNAVVAGSAQTTLINASPEPGPAPTPVLTLLSGATSGAGSTVSLGSFVQGEQVNRAQFQISNTATPPADSVAGTVSSVATGNGLSLELEQGSSNSNAIQAVAAGQSNNGVYVAIDTAATGSSSDTVTYAPTDVNASGYSAALATQSITVTDTVLAPATPVLLETGPFDFGNVHLGSDATSALTVQNTAASGAATLDVTPVVITGGVTASGTISQLAAGQQDSSSLSLGVDTSSAGAKSGEVQLNYASDAGGGNTLTAGSSPALQISGAVYRLAEPVVSGPVSTVVHVGDTDSGTITLTNAAPADGFSEGLLATATSTGAGFSASGSTGLIAAGSSDSSSVNYTVDTSQSGVVDGTVDLALTSDGTGTSGLGTTALATQRLGVSVAVDNYAVAGLAQGSGGNAGLSGSGDNYVLNFGSLSLGDAGSDGLEVVNTATGLADDLSGTFTVLSGGGFTLTGFGAFSGLGAGGTDTSPFVSVDDVRGQDGSGDYTETLQLTPTGSNASGYTETLAPITLTLEAEVNCFVRGTRILTTRGEVPIEALRVGDLAVTFLGAGAVLKPVRWLGHTRVDLRRHPCPEDARPVRIRANALAEGRPSRDLLVSPGHRFPLGGVLIEARGLVNGASIAQEAPDAVEYWHVEMDGHDILLADGLEAESYQDTGNRAMFANACEAGTVVALRPEVDFDLDGDAPDPCLPYGEADARLRARLIVRAKELGWRLVRDPAPFLEVAGQRILPVRTGNRYRFALPTAAAWARLCSRSVRPSDTDGRSTDHRRLGLSLRRLALEMSTGLREVALDDPRLSLGFSYAERDAEMCFRWTDGAAVLPLAELADGEAVSAVEITIEQGLPFWIHSELPGEAATAEPSRGVQTATA